MKKRTSVLSQEMDLAHRATNGAWQRHSRQDRIEQDCQVPTDLSAARSSLKAEILAHLQTIGLNGNRPDMPLTKDQVRYIQSRSQADGKRQDTKGAEEQTGRPKVPISGRN